MKKPRLEAIVAILTALLSLFAIINFIISEYETDCQSKVLFLQANNTEFFYRASVFSNAHITSILFVENFNKSTDNLEAWGTTFNLIQKQAQEFKADISKQINKCSKFNLYKYLMFIFQIIISGIILCITIYILQKTRK